MSKIAKVGIFIAFSIVFIFLFRFTLLKRYCEYKNKNALEKIAKMNSNTAPIFENFLKEIENTTDWHILIVSGYRTENEQVILKRLNQKNASPGKSKHNFAKAIDICAYQNHGFFGKRLLKGTNKNDWEESQILEIANKYGLNWGGNFKNYYDPVHFEIID